MFNLYSITLRAMNLPLQISTVSLSTETRSGHVFEMTGRCAFAICTRGEFDIKVFNEKYAVKSHCIFACMPFVKIEVIDVRALSEVVFGYIRIEDVPTMITRWINANNISAIQTNPLVEISGRDLERLITSIKDYESECTADSQHLTDSTFMRIKQDIIDFQSRLIVARVLNIYISKVPVKLSGNTHRDIVFQQFILNLYATFREHRDVQFYAERSGVSLKYFSTVVKQISGTSPSEWIETVVTGEAKTLLSDSHRSIKEIAALLNFPDAPTFTKYFLRVTGMTPKAYRKALS